MKSISNKLLFLLLFVFAVGCIEEFGDVGEARNRKDQVSGTWKVTSMIQKDLLTDNPDFASFDITDSYAFGQYTLTINSDGTFSTSNPGNAPEFVISTGTWNFDDEQFPSAIILTSGATTSTLDFGSLNSLTDRNELEVTFTRKVLVPNAQGDLVERNAIGYEYTLAKN